MRKNKTLLTGIKTDATDPLVDHNTVSWSVKFGGSGEIRTHGAVTLFSFQD